MEYILALVGALSFLLFWAGLTRPRPISRPQAKRDERYRLRELSGAGFLAVAVEDLAAWFRGRRTEDGRYRALQGGLNRRYLERLKQADWYWAPGEAETPTPEAPFWNLETVWAAKVLHGILFGLGGLALGGLLSLFYDWSAVVALVVALLAALVGFFDPDRELAEAAQERRNQIVLEMGYKVPELRVYVQSGRTFVSALRYLTDRPGGPFVRELYRALRIYTSTRGDMERGLRAVLERNRSCELLVNLCGDLLAVLEEGGEIGDVLEAHAEAALHAQRRQLRQQGQDNTQQMSYVVSATTLLVMFLLVGGPALWTVVTTL